MAAVMAATYPDLFSAVGIHSGLPYRSATDVPSAFAAMRGEVRRPSNVPAGTGNAPRMIVFHGSADKTVAPGNARLLMEDAQRTHGGARTLTRKLKTGSRMVEHTELRGPDGIPRAEFWMIAGAGHHWSGGDPSGSYSKPDGPSASQEMMRFFLGKPLSA